MIEDKIKKIIEQRLDEENYYYVECWEKAIEVLTSDIEDTKEFIIHKCDDDTLYWISEVFEEVIEKTQNKELVEIFKERANIVQNEEYKKSILYEVECAAQRLLNNV